MPFGFGSEGEDDHTADEPADCRDHQQKPRDKWMCRYRKPRQGSLAARARFRIVASDDAECIMFRNTGGHVKDNGTEPRHDAHQSRQPKKSDLCPKTVVAQLHDLGNPTENPVHGHKPWWARNHDIQRSLSVCWVRCIGGE
jgi:hypothetical protein